ncbi:hypothetical protein [Anaeromicrobium sediminis]|uniref:Uncharacterized protein n=1 Tax=Anaeromicrobium sediminis TaxID=1478221 RepID=A0A267MQL5_9FIRM|nr:hypothetical protein [Anaeromicrobium sediminis]PAB61020.1 hypothetical protein CCE28_00900 [Anaeromicrobium sediminis]
MGRRRYFRHRIGFRFSKKNLWPFVFASNSKEYASKHEIKLVNGDNLVKLIDKDLETMSL